MEPIKEFIKNKNGKATYKSWLEDFFETIEENSKTYFEKKRDYDTDVLKFVESEKIKKWAPATKKSAVSCIKNFLKFNNVRLQPRTEYQLKESCKGPKAISQEWVPDRNQLKQILSYGSVRHKALFLTMSSSGMRPGEALNITIDDIYMNETPVKIEIPYQSTRTKESRTTFISSEAKHWVKQWLRIREKYLTSQRNTAEIDDKRLFPFSNNTLRDMWIGLITKAGFDALDERNGKNRKRYKMTPQKLRKFFKTQMSDAQVPFEIYEALMGHEKGIEAVYRGYSINQLRQWYLKGEDRLLVFERPVNQDEIDRLDQQLKTMQSQMKSILDFQKRVTTTFDDDYKLQQLDIPSEVIVATYEQEQKRKKEAKFKKLVKSLGDEELAKEVWKLKYKEKA
jgi:integrase